jgi:SAM-dependent methyltransferase
VADPTYADYLELEWARFADDPQRAVALLESTGVQRVDCVLDVGCGAGQELLPYVERGALGVGIDVHPDAARHGRRLYGRHAPGTHAVFLTGSAEHLPFRDGSFDVAICRVALPYTDNARAIAEMARVLRPGGLLLLKIHHHRYYAAKMLDGLRSGEILSAVHAARVMAAGAVYYLTGRQPRTKWPSRETWQSERLLRRELRRSGMVITGRLPDSNPQTPSFVIRKAVV